MDGQKTPFGASINRLAEKKINDAMQQFGRALPCSVVSVDGAIITVNFDVNSAFTLPQIQVPLFGPEYIRYPIQPGDKGFTIPADTFLGAMSGLGSGTPDLSTPGNLSALVFMPIGNANWVNVDGQAVVIYGPNGCVIRDTGSGAVITLTPTGVNVTVGSTILEIDGTSITATASASFTINAPTIVLNGELSQGTGATSYPAHLKGPITVDNNVTAGGISLDTHHHTGVQTGSSNTGGPV